MKYLYKIYAGELWPQRWSAKDDQTPLEALRDLLIHQYVWTYGAQDRLNLTAEIDALDQQIAAGAVDTVYVGPGKTEQYTLQPATD